MSLFTSIFEGVSDVAGSIFGSGSTMSGGDYGAMAGSAVGSSAGSGGGFFSSIGDFFDDNEWIGNTIGKVASAGASALSGGGYGGGTSGSRRITSGGGGASPGKISNFGARPMGEAGMNVGMASVRSSPTRDNTSVWRQFMSEVPGGSKA